MSNGNYGMRARPLDEKRLGIWAKRVMEESTALARCTTDLAKRVLAQEFIREYQSSRNRYGCRDPRSVRIFHLKKLLKELKIDESNRDKLVRDKYERKSMLRGISRRGNVWRAWINHNGKYVHLGMFDSVEGAVVARQQAELKIIKEALREERNDLQ